MRGKRRKKKPREKGVLSDALTRSLSAYAVKLLGSSVRGKKGSLVFHHRPSLSLPSYSYYSTDPILPQKDQWFGRLITSYRLCLLVWLPNVGAYWHASMRVVFKLPPTVFMAGHQEFHWRIWFDNIRNKWIMPGTKRHIAVEEKMARYKRENK